MKLYDEFLALKLNENGWRSRRRDNFSYVVHHLTNDDESTSDFGGFLLDRITSLELELASEITMRNIMAHNSIIRIHRLKNEIALYRDDMGHDIESGYEINKLRINNLRKLLRDSAEQSKELEKMLATLR